MLTIKKRAWQALWILAAAFLTGCGAPGPRALLKGERLISEGKPEEAISKIEEATRLLPSNPPEIRAQAWNWLGLARHLAGRPAEAIAAYDEAIKLDRNLAAADYNLGWLHFEQKNYGKAIDALNKYLGLREDADGKQSEVCLLIGTAHFRQTGLSVGNEKNRQLDYARKYIEAANRTTPTPEALNQLGMIQLLRYRSPNTAIAKFKEALRVQPKYPPAILNMAIVFHHYLNERRLALQYYREYLSLQPTPQDASEVEAVVNSLLKGEAVPVTTIAPPATQPTVKTKIETDASSQPSEPALTLQETNVAKLPASVPPTTIAVNPPKAPTPAREVATASPPSRPETASPSVPAPKPSVASTNVAKVPPTKPASPAPVSTARYRYVSFNQPSQGKRSEAVRLVAQGQLARQNNNTAAAITAYRSAIKADPSHFEAYFELATVTRESGDMPAALDALNRAVIVKPDSADARYAFAWSLHKSKYPEDAINELEKLLKQKPTDLRARVLAANIYAQDLHQPALARAHYQKLLDLDPKHPQAATIRSWLTANP